MSEPIQITVRAEDEGRIDKALANHYPNAGRRQLAALFDEGQVKLRGRRAKKGDRVSAGDVIELLRAPVGAADLYPVADPDVALDILLERPDFVVVNKPAGIPSQPLRAAERGTIANGVAARFPECATIAGADPRDGGLVHRLDIGTSGALVVARTTDAYRALRDAFGQGLVEKQYLAITDERPVSRDCDAPLVQRGDHVRVDHTDGLAAYTSFTVEKASPTHALVRCIAQTGRMHQVRAHLAHVGAPIAGDTLYGGKLLGGGDAGFYLHAAVIAFPLGTEKIRIEAPLPSRFTAALAAAGLA
jgi:23S rRNA pseudouridine1911/1915/1917 synthase